MSNEKVNETAEGTGTATTSRGPKLKDEGNYRGTILRHELGLTANKSLCLTLIARFVEKENDNLEYEPLETPFTVKVPVYLTPKAKDNSEKTLAYYGYYEGHEDDRSLSRLNPKHPEAFSFEGKPITATCSHEEYLGRPKTNWRIQRANKPADDVELDAALTALAEEWAADDQATAEFDANARF